MATHLLFAEDHKKSFFFIRSELRKLEKIIDEVEVILVHVVAVVFNRKSRASRLQVCREKLGH